MLTRIISGIIGIALAIFIIRLGGIPYLGAVMILTAIGLIEFYRMAGKKGLKPFRVTGIFAGLIIILAAYFNNTTYFPLSLLMATLLGTLFLMFSIQLYKNGFEDALRNVSITYFGVFYVAALSAHFVLLRNLEDPILPGKDAIWFALICTWSTDTFAYFVGRSFGRTPLAPKVSPKKTVAGFVGGVLGSILAGFIISVIIGFNPMRAILMAALIGFVGQVGDLFESALKRDAAIKDSGNLIPGHGGVLDRFDSALFTLPLTYYLIIYLL